MILSFEEKQVAVMKTALDYWGLQAQVDQTVEEMAELIVALHKHAKRVSGRGTLDDVLDEIADVEMMLAQMRLTFGIDDDTLRERIDRKMAKLEDYLDKDGAKFNGR
jgi:NTP pyrophosphatase (non-canonical NTP hydrolase)